jgi:hypothetical protein
MGRIVLISGGDRVRRCDLLEDTGGLSCGDFLRHAAGDQVAEDGEEPTGHLVTRPGQVAVPFGPHLQDGGVIVRGHLPPGPGAQRCDRDRQGVVRVVLIGVTGLQQPHPGGQLGLHIQDPLTGVTASTASERAHWSR